MTVSVSITGDFAKLKKWEAFARYLESPTFQAQVTRETANSNRTLIAQGFEKERDPFGNPWAEKKRPNGYKILHGKTAKLRKFFVSRLTQNEFSLKSSAPYFRPHQDGAKRKGTNWKLPRRQMMPEGGQLPPAYFDAFQKAYRKHRLVAMRKFGLSG